MFTVAAGAASIYSVWLAKPTPQVATSAATLLEARVDKTIARRVYDGPFRTAGPKEGERFHLMTDISKPEWPESAAAIDLKFRNDGAAAAFLWKVVIQV